MKAGKNAATLDNWLHSLASEVARADAEMQLLQRTAWNEFSKERGILEGLDRLHNLALSDIRLTFNVAPVPRSLWHRFGESFRVLLGRVTPWSVMRTPLALSGSKRITDVQVEVTIRRSVDDRWTAEQREGKRAEEAGGMHVA